jgi:hypothetical protein
MPFFVAPRLAAGKGGIRTHGRLPPPPVFKFDRIMSASVHAEEFPVLVSPFGACRPPRFNSVVVRKNASPGCGCNRAIAIFFLVPDKGPHSRAARFHTSHNWRGDLSGTFLADLGYRGGYLNLRSRPERSWSRRSQASHCRGLRPVTKGHRTPRRLNCSKKTTGRG